MRPATLTCAMCGALVSRASDGGRCPKCHRVVTGTRQRVDLLARALPRTRATAALRAAIRAYLRERRAAARRASRGSDPLGFDLARILAGERSADAGRVRPVAAVVAELRQAAT